MHKETISKAISEKKKITFFYNHEKRTISPWLLAKQKGKIILLGHEEFPKTKSIYMKPTESRRELYNKKNIYDLNLNIKIFDTLKMFNLDILTEDAKNPPNNSNNFINLDYRAVSTNHPEKYEEIYAKI